MDQKVEKVIKEILEVFKIALTSALAFFNKVLLFIRETDWKGFAAGFRDLTKNYDANKARFFVKQHKRPLLIILVALCLVLILLDSAGGSPVPEYRREPQSSGSGISGGSGVRESPYCLVCKGVKICVICDGLGSYSNYGFTSECKACDGTGDCWKCNGTGLR